MVLSASRPRPFLAIAAALFAGGSCSIFASAFDMSASNCADLAALPTGSLTEDSYLSLGSDVFMCDEVTTVTADGPYTFTVYGSGSATVFYNVRFEVSGGANLLITDLVADQLRSLTGVTFTGVTELASDGGVFNVELGSSATFNMMSTFQHNSVQAANSGGAVYAGGLVRFRNTVTFNENSVLSDENNPSGSGGALFVGHGGSVVFGGVSDFTYNEAGSGGQGGAIANFGSVLIDGPSGIATFTDNVAPAFVSVAGDATGGHGGAIFTGASAVTSISGLQSASHNRAFSGGAIYNLGNTLLTSTTNDFTTQFMDNDAEGDDTGNGGHIFTSGVVYAQDACILTYGHATGNGGAVYIDVEGSFNSGGELIYVSNTADGECDNVYASGVNPVCQPSSVAGLGPAVKSH